jgi:hypothetical protein
MSDENKVTYTTPDGSVFTFEGPDAYERFIQFKKGLDERSANRSALGGVYSSVQKIVEWLGGDGADVLVRPLLARLTRDLRSAAVNASPKPVALMYFAMAPIGRILLEAAYDSNTIAKSAEALLSRDGVSVQVDRQRIERLYTEVLVAIEVSDFTKWTALYDATAKRPEAVRLAVARQLLLDRLDAAAVLLDMPSPRPDLTVI